jgi:uncharacterized protein (DUF302 family)
MKRFVVLVLACLWLTQVSAESSSVLTWTAEQDMETTYKVVYNHLENNRLFVVFEPDIQRNLSRFAERWGEDYNRNKLEGIRSMVFCNAWYANRVSNADPTMLALCPLHVTLIQEMGKTRVLFARPTVIARDSEALSIARELEQDVSKAIDAAVNELRGCPAAC